MPLTIKKKKKTKISDAQLAELQRAIIDDKNRSVSPETTVYRSNQAKWIKQIDGNLQKEKQKEDWQSTISLPFTYTECEIVGTRIYQALSEGEYVVTMKPVGEEDIEVTKTKEQWFNWYLTNYVKAFDETKDRTIMTTTRLGMAILYAYYERQIKRILHKRIFEKIQPEAFLDEVSFDNECILIIRRIFGNNLIPGGIKSIGEFKYSVKYLRKTPIASINEEVEDTAILDFYPYEAESKIEIEVEESIVEYDGVKSKELSLDNVWFPSTVVDNEELQECDYIILKFETNYSDIVSKQKDGIYDLLTKEDLKDFLKPVNSTEDTSGRIKREVQSNAGLNDSIETDKSRGIKYYEYYKKYDINQDGINEDIVVTYFPDHKKITRVKWLNQIFKSGTRPIDITNYGVREGSIYSYGVAEILNQVQEEADVLHNQFIEFNTISNTPFAGIRQQSTFSNTLEKKDFKLKPGMMLPLDDVNDIKFYGNPTNQNWNLTDISLLLGQGQDAIGTNDTMLGKQQHSRTPVGSTLKMLAEANIRIKQSLIRFNRAYKSHLKKIYQLARDYGPAEQVFRVMGEKGDFQFLSITREDLKNLPDFELGTSLDNLNKVYMREVWLLLYQQVLNPFLLQTGLIQNPNIYEMLKKIFESYDIKDYHKLITKPIENPLISQEEENIRMMQGEQMEINPLDNHQKHKADIEKFEADDIKMGVFPHEYIHLLAAHEKAHNIAIQQQEIQMQMQAQGLKAQGGEGAAQDINPAIQRPKVQPMMPPGGQPQGMMQTGG